MAPQKTFQHVFANGLTLVAEEMDWLESAAFTLLMPAGCQYETPAQSGLGSLTCEMVQRGAGTRDSRQFVSDLENLGADTSANVSGNHTSFGGAMPAESLEQVLAIYAECVLEPHFPADQFDDAQSLCIQEARSLEDDLAHRLMIEARQRFYAEPFGRSSTGTVVALESLQLDDVQEFYKKCYRPQNAILAVAGKIDWPKLRDQVGQIFADWQGSNDTKLREVPPPRGYRHIMADSQQVHLTVAFPSPSYREPDYFQMRGAIGVLSDGMSSRLFTEVREKRGLCYTVYASCHSLRDRGGVFTYAGTTAERAQETLDVLWQEILRLYDGVEEDELARLKRRIKRSLIIQQESSTSRAGSLAADWFYLGRLRPVDELRNIIDSLSQKSINHYLAGHPPRDLSAVTLGPQPLEMPNAVS